MILSDTDPAHFPPCLSLRADAHPSAEKLAAFAEAMTDRQRKTILWDIPLSLRGAGLEATVKNAHVKMLCSIHHRPFALAWANPVGGSIACDTASIHFATAGSFAAPELYHAAAAWLSHCARYFTTLIALVPNHWAGARLTLAMMKFAPALTLPRAIRANGKITSATLWSRSLGDYRENFQGRLPS